MSNDTIKRSDAIKALDNAWINGTSLLDADEAVKQLKDLPSADRQTDWIPCSERLPSEGQECFGTDEYGQIRHVFKDKCGESEFATVEEYMHIKIVAWMPLPEPWKEGE